MEPPLPPPSLQPILGIPGVGALVVQELSILERVRLRRLCTAFRSCVDESFLSQEHILGSDMDGLRGGRFWDVAQWLADKCPKLLAFKYCHELATHPSNGSSFGVDTDPLVSETLLRISATCHRLRSLDLGGCASVDNAAIVAVASQCHELQDVNVQLTSVTDTGITALASHCPHLRSLIAGQVSPPISGCFSASAGLALTSSGISDASISLLADNCPHLYTLKLRDCPEVTDTSMAKIASRCKRLRALNVRGSRVTDASMTILALENRELQHLNVKYCRGVTDASIALLAAPITNTNANDYTNSNNDTNNYNLQSLKLASCDGVTDDTITAICEHCPSLKRLNIEGCSRVTDGSLQFLGIGLPLLASLNIEGCTQVSDDSMAMAALTLTHLEHLRAARTGLTDDTLRVLSESCNWLQTLEVSGQGITDAGVVAVAQNCRRLRWLCLYGCLVTDAGLEAVAAACPRLDTLSVHACESVTVPGITALVTQCTWLHTLSLRQGWDYEEVTKLLSGVAEVPKEFYCY